MFDLDSDVSLESLFLRGMLLDAQILTSENVITYSSG